MCPAAEGQYFNARYDLIGSVGNSGTGWGVEVIDDTTFFVVCNGSYQDTLFYSSAVRGLVIDEAGVLLNEDRVADVEHATYPGWSNSVHKRIDGGFVVGGSNFRSDSLDNWIQRPVLYFFDAQGAFEQQIPLGPGNQSWIGRQAKQTPDGGYVICGETSAVGNALQAFVIKTDAQGNEEWTQTYGGQWNDFAMAIDRHEGTNYFMGGQRFIASNKQLWVQCLDDTGGVAWSKVWGSAFGEPNAHLTLAADGHPLVASSWGSAANDRGRKYLAKLDSADGVVLWEKQYGLTCACPFFVVQEVLPGGDLIAAGQDVIANEYYGVLLRTTSTGDSLWMRQYQYHDSLVSNGRGLFRDVVPTPDGGFIAVGTALQAGPYTQDVWVVKVDSMGCLEPGCHLILGMVTQITNLRGALTVAPNPVAQGGNVQVQLQLPESFTVQGALRITVTDAMGRVAHEQTLSGEAGHRELRGTKQEAIPASLTTTQLPSGLYHIHLTDATRWIAGAKLIVE